MPIVGAHTKATASVDVCIDAATAAVVIPKASTSKAIHPRRAMSYGSSASGANTAAA